MHNAHAQVDLFSNRTESSPINKITTRAKKITFVQLVTQTTILYFTYTTEKMLLLPILL